MLNKTKESITTSIQFVNPSQLYNPSVNAYSHVAVVSNKQRIIHISGQGGENIKGMLSSNFEGQLTQCFSNIQSALKSVEADLINIAVLRILIVKHNKEKHELLIKHMSKLWKDISFPACTLIPVDQLALPNMQIEIEATAY